MLPFPAKLERVKVSNMIGKCWLSVGGEAPSHIRSPVCTRPLACVTYVMIGRHMLCDHLDALETSSRENQRTCKAHDSSAASLSVTTPSDTLV
jgi:hypothetical protein